jgi:GNAT superfamily N-acetyltransferase
VVRERFLVVAEGAGTIAGFGQLNQASGEVDAVYVLPERQRQGIGRALLRALEDAARAAGIEKLPDRRRPVSVIGRARGARGRRA